MPIKPNSKSPSYSSATRSPSIHEVDPKFEPWEPVRPIPIFLVAITMVLGLTGVWMYVSDYTLSTPVMTATPATSETVFAKSTPFSGPADAPLLVTQGHGQVWSCISCHGALGQGASITPRIAGLPREYVAKQLKDFASGERPHDTMGYVARALSEADIDELSDYYASLAIPTLNIPPTDADIRRGQDVFLKGDQSQEVVACMTCHGPDGRGRGSAFPPLAGQQPDYLFSQLLAWKAGRRHSTPPQLMEAVAHLDAEDLYAVAHYVAALPPSDDAPSMEATGSHNEASRD